MNLRALANLGTSQINGNQSITWLQNTGYTTNSAGKRTPTQVSVTVKAQVQAMSAADLKYMEALNIQGIMRKVYMYGNPQGVVRVDQKGGDILQFPEVPGGTVRNWLVNQVMETWPEWACVIVILQAN